MAAVLKKRVVAEFTSVTSDDEKSTAVVKRLRLASQSKRSNQIYRLRGDLSSKDALQLLVEVERSLPLELDDYPQAISCLLERFAREQHSVVRAKIACLLGQFGKGPSLKTTDLADDIVRMINTENSHAVKSQLLSAAINVGRTRGSHVGKLHQQFVDCALQLLRDSSPLVRCKCLELIGALGSPDHSVSADVGQSESSGSTLSILGSYSCDPDGRVRTQAFQSMLMWHQRGILLEQNVYSLVCAALKDDYEGVRLAAVKLVWVFAHIYPEHVVKVKTSTESIRLVDDGFAKICNMMNDLSMRVRAEAASLLGSLHDVSPHFLQQTLDKKLMSNMRYKRSTHERDYCESGEWSSGQKWADDSPKDDVDPQAVSLISTGSCGAFVHGLEDEFLEVRNAAVDSLCELATHSTTFAKLSQDFLVDMFNDEIEAVRLNAINSLRKICHHFLLREDQLDIMLSVLKDSNFEIREALREMLSCCRVSTKECLNVVVLAMLDNLSRYPEDRSSIWNCMMNLGQHHQSLVVAMTPDLLSLHLYFESIEPDIDDPAYVSILLLVLNATVDSVTMLTLFPHHLLSHYTCLRNTLPYMLPSLPLAGVVILDSDNSLSSSQVSGPSSFFTQTLQRLESVRKMDRQMAVRMMNIAIRDLRQLEQIESTDAATADCCASFLQCQTLLCKALDIYGGSTRSTVRCQQTDVQLIRLQHSMADALKRMEHQFVGLGSVELSQIHQLMLRVEALNCLSGLEHSATVTQLCPAFLDVLSKVNESLMLSGTAADPFTAALLTDQPTLKHCSVVEFRQLLSAALNDHVVMMPRFENQLRKLVACIVEPAADSELVLKFSAGLAVSLNLVTTVNNVQYIDRLRVQVRYPDQQKYLIIPPSTDFKRLSVLRHRLVTKVTLSHVLWSDPCQVYLSLVYLCPSTPCLPSVTPTADTGTIELCRPVAVTISPLPAKR